MTKDEALGHIAAIASSGGMHERYEEALYFIRLLVLPHWEMEGSKEERLASVDKAIRAAEEIEHYTMGGDYE